jgi:hypothetical protein
MNSSVVCKRRWLSQAEGPLLVDVGPGVYQIAYVIRVAVFGGGCRSRTLPLERVTTVVAWRCEAGG